MVLTEEEAKTKWCPHKRVDSYEGNSNYNTHADGDLPDESKCIASDCMMWRWDEASDRDENGNLIGGTNYNTEGHCGLGG